MKDLGITQEFMDHNGFETALPEVVRGYLTSALDQVEPTADHTKMLVNWEKRSGVTLPTTQVPVRDIPDADFEHRLAGLNRP